MPYKSNQTTGFLGENLAREFLEKKGFKILQNNFKARYGEIDIVALDKDSLVFVEVKTRKSSKFGTPQEAITTRKQSELIKTSQLYKNLHPELPETMRIDAVCIILSKNDKVEKIDYYRNITG